MSVRSRQFAVTLWGHGALCVTLSLLVCWALLTPDPYAVIRTTSLGWLESLTDTLVHAGVFGILSLVLLTFSVRISGSPPPAVLFGLLGYCLLMEWLQLFVPGRTCDPRDAVANLIGFLFGVGCTKAILTIRMKLLAV
ncbi:MAG: VanZ family protein [Planctomycetaceae bacterium]